MITRRLVVLISLLISLVFSCQLCEGTRVNITNYLGPNTDLTVHCKSKDDDLGVRVLSYNASYQFSFIPNFFMSTLYFCGFRWGRTRDLHWFDIFNAGERPDKCTTCLWRIVTDGPCLWNSETQQYDCHPWNKENCVFFESVFF